MQALFKEAESDKFVGGSPENVNRPGSKHIAIIDESNGEIAGFFTPKTTNILGVNYHRAGTLYTAKKYRKKGVMEKALGDYFKKHMPALSWIEEGNVASTALFKKLGFVKDKPHVGGHWWKKDKPATASLESRPVYLEW